MQAYAQLAVIQSKIKEPVVAQFKNIAIQTMKPIAPLTEVFINGIKQCVVAQLKELKAFVQLDGTFPQMQSNTL
jgi:hypothetical protein